VIRNKSITPPSTESAGEPKNLLAEPNRRRSILYHLLVPGGRWLTTMTMPSWFAGRYSSRFHKRKRGPLLPPPSATINRWMRKLDSWRSGRSGTPASRLPSTESTPTCSATRRSINPPDCGRAISRTFQCGEDFCTRSRSLTAQRGRFCRGDCGIR
jgi:hypothetical protein